MERTPHSRFVGRDMGRGIGALYCVLACVGYLNMWCDHCQVQEMYKHAFEAWPVFAELGTYGQCPRALMPDSVKHQSKACFYICSRQGEPASVGRLQMLQNKGMLVGLTCRFRVYTR